MDVSCQCGAIQFRTSLPKPLAVYICHCTGCQHQSASAFGSSAIFPKFPLPSSILPSLACYKRLTNTGETMNCYFCQHCGTRVMHTTPGKNVVCIKGGLIDGLRWQDAKHIWTKNALVPIPEGVESCEEEPEDDEGAGIACAQKHWTQVFKKADHTKDAQVPFEQATAATSTT